MSSSYKELKWECYEANRQLDELGLVIYTFDSDAKLDGLYNLSKDHNEHQNLINSNDKYVLKKKDELKKLLIQKIKEIGDTLTIK